VVVAAKCPNQTSRESTTAGNNCHECAGAKSTTAARAGCSRCLTNRAQAAVQIAEAHALIVAVGLFRSAFGSVGLGFTRSVLLNYNAAAEDFDAHIAAVVKIKLDGC